MPWRICRSLMLGLYAATAGATPIDVTDRAYIALPSGADVVIQFGVTTYAHNNRMASPYPANIEFLLMTTSLPESGSARHGNTVYFPEYQFQAWIESLDGTVRAPLADTDAHPLNLPLGTLVLKQGSIGRNKKQSAQVGILQGEADLSLSLSQQLFGSRIGDYNDAAQIRITNLGPAFTIGLGPEYTVGNAVSFPSLKGNGNVETAGIRGAVIVENPEPGSLAMFFGGFALLAACRWAARRRNLRGCPGRNTER
jgi:hypothetical protein